MNESKIQKWKVFKWILKRYEHSRSMFPYVEEVIKLSKRIEKGLDTRDLCLWQNIRGQNHPSGWEKDGHSSSLLVTKQRRPSVLTMLYLYGLLVRAFALPCIPVSDRISLLVYKWNEFSRKWVKTHVLSCF